MEPIAEGAVDKREEIKNKLRQCFDGKIVRKDLTKKIKEGANVPVYVLEFLLGQYCSSDDDEIIQKGVDMRIGVDMTSLALKKQVDQIILISGDSDFVPAAKLARREGIDFVLDPMWAPIKDDLFEHIDGMHSNWGKKKENSQE